MSNPNVGVITEQGFVAGNNLGFTPIKENELNPKNEKDDKEDDKK